MRQHRWIKWIGATRLQPLLFFFLIGLGVLSASRLALTLWKSAQVSAVDGWAQVLIQGVRVDIASLCLLLVPLATLVLLLPKMIYRWRVTGIIIATWLTLILTLLVGLEFATPEFMAEYGLRPNRLFIEYLIYPREIAETRLARRWQRPAEAQEYWPLRIGLAFVVLLIGAMGVRSTSGHRPMNPAMLAFSTDPTVNVLPLNSFYSLVHAARDAARSGESALDLYGKLPEADVIAAVRADSGLLPEAFIDPAIPTLAARTPIWHGKPKNLVIVLEESMGAQFVGSLGGLPLTPHYDQLSERGWAFTRLYATGTRSVRGIEAVLAGFSPTPAQAVVKRPKAQHDFFTLAALLRRHGYDTTFYYGGESHFDKFFAGDRAERLCQAGVCRLLGRIG